MQAEDRSAITITEEYDRVYKGDNDPVLKDSGTGKSVGSYLYCRVPAGAYVEILRGFPTTTPRHDVAANLAVLHDGHVAQF